MTRKTLPFWIICIVVIVAGALLLSVTGNVQAGPAEQVTYQTPTALPDGRILYRVKEGDTCLSLQLLTGVTVADIIALNRLDDACTLPVGVDILLSVVTPEPTATPNPDITATPLLPTATPERGTGEICIVLFADTNGNAVREETEPAILGGAVSVSDRTGAYSDTGLTTDTDTPLCFIDLPEGEYNISMAIPAGYNPTTATNYPLQLLAGNRSLIDFGAQASLIRPPDDGTADGSGRSPILLVVGALLILGGIALGIYFRFLRGGSTT